MPNTNPNPNHHPKRNPINMSKSYAYFFDCVRRIKRAI